MNLKKGLTRLFVLGLAISVIVGYILERQSSAQTSLFYYKAIEEIKVEMTYPECQNMLHITNRNDLPDRMHYLFGIGGKSGTCPYVFTFWSDIKKRQLEIKTQEINVKFVQDAIRDKGSDIDTKNLLGFMALFVGGYFLVCLLAWLIFIMLRWVKRGFSS